MLFGRGEKLSRLDLDDDYTGNRYPRYFSLYGKLYIKRENHIGYMAIILSLGTRIITPNARIIQPFNISYGVTHKS